MYVFLTTTDQGAARSTAGKRVAGPAFVLRALVLGDPRASTHHHRLVCMHVPRRPIRRPPGDARRSTCGPAVPPERDCLCRTLSTNSSTQPYPYPTVLGRVPVPTRSWPSQQQRRRQFYRGRQKEMAFYRGRRIIHGYTTPMVKLDTRSKTTLFIGHWWRQ